MDLPWAHLGGRIVQGQLSVLPRQSARLLEPQVPSQLRLKLSQGWEDTQRIKHLEHAPEPGDTQL